MSLSLQRLSRIIVFAALAWLTASHSAILADELSAKETDGKANRTHLIVDSVRDLGVQFMKNDVDVTGQDAASSIVVSEESSLWLFGDTMEGPFESVRDHPLADVLSNTACLVPKQDVAQGILQFEYLKDASGKRPRQVIAFAPDEDRAERRLWAVHGVCVDPFIYVFYHNITLLPGTSVFTSFKLNGMGIARAKIGEYAFERLVAPDGTREFWKGDLPTFGVFVQKLPDDYVYLWGSLGTGMYLARISADSLTSLADYEYLVEAPTLLKPDVAPRWSREFSPTAPLFDSVPNEMSASYNSYLKQFVAVHVHHGEQKLALRTAPAMSGPWSQPEYFHAPEKKDAWTSFYAGKEHPELARDKGRILYVTFVSSSVYAPHLLEVTLNPPRP
jgi:Domain of unknown function (DUF4185)